MNSIIKNQIRKIVRKPGSHIGVVRHLIISNNPEVNFEEYKEFTETLITKKLKNTESKIRASVRYQ